MTTKFLTLKKGVILTPHIEHVILAFDKFFEIEGKKAVVTSGLRTAEKQLEIIKEKCKRHGIEKEFPMIVNAGLVEKITFELKYNGDKPKEIQIFSWQKAWSRLLTIGEMVNPPLQAACLFEYKRNGSIIPAGKLIDVSPHMKGTAFDIGGGENLIEKVAVVKDVYEMHSIKGFKGYLVETVNNAIHIDCWKIADIA